MDTKLTSAVTIAWLSLPATSFAVPTVYSYTGQYYSIIQDDPTVPGSYAEGMRIEGSFVVPDVIPPDSAVVLNPLRDEIGSIRFTDGRIRYDAGINFSPFSITTDSTGNVIDWSFRLSRYNFSEAELPPRFFSELHTTSRCSGGTPCDTASIRPSALVGADQGIAIAIGTWAVRPVPEPSKWALLLAGIALVSVAVTRRLSSGRV